MPTYEVRVGDCIELMAEIESASLDAIVTDPPYGIGFMGKEWDVFKPEVVAQGESRRERKGTPRSSKRYPDRVGKAQGGGPSIQYDESLSGNQRFQAWMTNWAVECLRILKPGGHLLAFGGTRTYHRLACAIEDAGFEVRDSLLWLYGTGFPKSHNLDGEWEGWGTALKPAHEPIVVARKPPVGTVRANVLKYGTGALNVDGCQIGTSKKVPASVSRTPGSSLSGSVDGSLRRETGEERGFDPESGRWPANVVLSHTPLCEPVGTRIVKGDPRDTGNGERPGGFADVGAESGDTEPNAPVYGDEEVIEWDCAPGCPVATLDAQGGGTSRNPAGTFGYDPGSKGYGGEWGQRQVFGYGDSGGASRFFYQAKTSRAERNAGLEGFEEKTSLKVDPTSAMAKDGRRGSGTGANHHPTVKPIDLMRWLVRLITPPGGTILDPFTGSGSTGCAAVLEGFDFIGIEREAEYAEIADARIAWWAEHRGKEAEEVLGMVGKSEKVRRERDEAGQLGLGVG